MNAPLYTIEILRLAASLPDPHPLDRIDGSARQRSPTCGSTVATEVQLADGRIEALSQQVSACAFGQASAALVASHAPGRSAQQVEAAFNALSDWLQGNSDEQGEWPDLEALAPARSRKSRHGAILLPFRALLAAIGSAK
jgi:NifU-like protein involved in Fe-S cluster formation